jgi:protein-L-isoaspartate(D-aspartate) O-methyltransferase
LTAEAPEVALVSGSLSAGWPAQAPYDLILIEGAVSAIPTTLAAQLHQETGRLLTAIRRDGGITQAVQAEATNTGVAISALFDCGTPEIPSLRKAPAFAF